MLVSPRILTLLMLLSLSILACEKRGEEGSGDVKVESNQKDMAASGAARGDTSFAICSSLEAFLANDQHQKPSASCCWQGQTLGSSGCQGVPTSCPEPLLVHPPEQRCDVCAGAPSCQEALVSCKAEGGKSCLIAASNYARNSQGLRDDLLRSTSLFLAACEAGNLLACNNAAIHFERAIGVSQDITRAISLFERSCPREQEVAPGCKNLARIYQLQGKRAQARDLLSERCTSFSSPAECSELLNLEYGEALGAQVRDEAAKPDFVRLVELAKKACDLEKFPKGCTQLATLLIASSQVEKSSEAKKDGDDAPLPEEALELLDKACAAREPTACFELAKLYHSGESGIEQDEKRAFALYDGACQGQVIAACGQAAMLYTRFAVAPPTTMDNQARIQRALQLGALACSQAEISGCQALAMLEHTGERAASDHLARIRTSAKQACSATPSNLLQCALLGELQVRGLGGDLALEEGKATLENACSRGVIGACQRLSSFKK